MHKNENTSSSEKVLRDMSAGRKQGLLGYIEAKAFLSHSGTEPTL
jgi:hypothetical protein